MSINIKEFYKEVVSCEKCELCKTRNTVVFGEGNLQADIMFIGEGPGQREDEQARPFVGPAGKLLDSMIEGIGLKRKDVYIANIVKCRPPKNRDPFPEEQEACLPFLRKQVAIIKPKIIICLGRISASVILKRQVRMTKEHGVFEQAGSFLIMPTFHPAALLHNSMLVDAAKKDFEIIKQKYEEIVCLR